jgi:N-acetylglutamate synthase-like GNAT family acetyltransferase
MANKVIINDTVFLSRGFTISTDKNLLNLNYIYEFLTQQSYWAKNLPYDKFQTSIENSSCFGVYHHQKQIGFARVISDNSTFAYLADVFIDTNYRKQSLSKWLLQTILTHSDYTDLRRWFLATADAHGLYQQFGFDSLNQPERFMQIFKPYSAKS